MWPWLPAGIRAEVWYGGERAMSELDAILADIRREDDPNRKNLRVAEVVSR